jgi:hypothetical protein
MGTKPAWLVRFWTCLDCQTPWSSVIPQSLMAPICCPYCGGLAEPGFPKLVTEREQEECRKRAVRLHQLCLDYWDERNDPTGWPSGRIAETTGEAAKGTSKTEPSEPQAVGIRPRSPGAEPSCPLEAETQAPGAGQPLCVYLRYPDKDLDGWSCRDHTWRPVAGFPKQATCQKCHAIIEWTSSAAVGGCSRL